MARREETHWLQRTLKFTVAGRNRRGRPLKTWRKLLKKTKEFLTSPTLTQLPGQHGGEPSNECTVHPHKVEKGY